LATAGSRNNSITTVMDIYPTIVELLGDDPATFGFDGDSFASGLHGELWQRSEPLFWQYWPGGSHLAAGYYHNFAVRDGPWKLVKEMDALYLFNISNDPTESTDLKDAQPAIVSDLLNEFSAWRTSGFLFLVDDMEKRST